MRRDRALWKATAMKRFAIYVLAAVLMFSGSASRAAAIGCGAALILACG
jgi:hypothetical protein